MMYSTCYKRIYIYIYMFDTIWLYIYIIYMCIVCICIIGKIYICICIWVVIFHSYVKLPEGHVAGATAFFFRTYFPAYDPQPTRHGMTAWPTTNGASPNISHESHVMPSVSRSWQASALLSCWFVSCFPILLVRLYKIPIPKLPDS